ncbi:MAG: SusD/RagB family nutrient-binding outer membrane lipoprotein, partial [Bacteroidales bacterium]|nr:SusD/RagB family nutrient-binding outer membrane lipoprotein [Bacteroidales bacterium]
MKTIKYISIVLILILGISSCELPDNVDPKSAVEVPVSTLFSNAEVALVNQVNAMSVNLNISRLIVQYWQETTYFDEARYNFQDRKIPDAYAREFYRDVLIDLKRAKSLLNAQSLEGFQAIERDNKIHIIGILETYSWHCIIDAFGDMPYSQALLGSENTTPVYDDAASVYTDIITNLKADIAGLNPDEGSFGGADFVYDGDVASWKKFGASLLLRLGIRLADVNAAAAQSAVETAINAGVFTNQDESFFLFYTGITPHVNCIYDGFTNDGRKDYLPTNTIVDKMNELKDPRLPLYFTLYEDEYVGAVAGLDGAQTYALFSHFAPRFFEASFEAILIDYVEVEFLLAEAAERGIGSSGAADHYANAITASVVYWGGDETVAADYIATVPYASANWKEVLGTQKWIALYNRGVEAWAEWRRLDFPILNVPEGMVYGD